MVDTLVESKTILVADDTAFVRERFRTALEQAGHRALVTGSAAELLGVVRADGTRLDLVLLDLRLSNARGVDLVRSIRKLDAGRISLLVFSGTVAGADEVRELAKLGVSGYVNEYSAVRHILPALTPHLFPDSFNRRGSPRVLLAIPVQYRVGSTIASALTLNLSHGGVAIRTTSPLETAATVRIRFKMPGSGRDIDADGRVAWRDTRLGMGIQFSGVVPASQAVIDEFVDAHFFSNRKA